MNEEPMELLRQRLVPMFSDDFLSLQMDTGKCEVFGNVVNGYVNVDSYKNRTIQSDILRVFTQPSYKVIGLNMGTWENPSSAMRFIDYKQGILIVPTNETEPVEFWCGGKYFEKFSRVSPIVPKNISGNAALIHLLEDQRAMLVIITTPRKELYLKNLMIGDSNHLIICDEIGATITPRKGWIEFKEAFCNLDKKTKAEALIVLRGVNSGRIEQLSERVQNFYSLNMDFAKIASSTLPSSPMARSIWYSALGGL